MYKWTLLIVLWFHAMWTLGADHFLEFRQVSPKGGFTFGSIHQIIEDSHGFIWFGSHHGLFRYNTQAFDKFVHLPTDAHSIPSNYITAITKDAYGTLWFATDNGICFYNEQKGNFERCSFVDTNSHKTLSTTTQIIASDSHHLWTLADRKLYLSDSQNFKSTPIQLDVADSLASFIYVDKTDRLWVKSTTGTVYWADKPYNTFQKFGQVVNQPVLSMLFTQNKLWIAYESSGADCYDIYGKIIGHYGKNQPEAFDIKSDRVRKVFEDNLGQIWLATYNGIVVLQNGRPTLFNDKNTRGLMHSSIYDIFIDSKKGIWVGTWSGTLSYANPYDNTFSHLSSLHGLSNNVVSSISERNGIVWIGTEGGGLNAFNPRTESIQKININPDLNDEQNVKAIEVDNQQALWVGTFNDGLWVVRRFDPMGNPLSPQKVMQGGFYSLKKDGKYIWAASYYMGLFKIDTETLAFENYRSKAADPNAIGSDQLRSLLIDSKGELWIGTQSGLGRLKKGEDKFRHYLPDPVDPNSLAGKQIYSIFEDNRQRIWIGTSSGLSLYDSTNDAFTNFGPKQGLSGYEIYGITQDAKGQLWISTDNGISQMDGDKRSFRNFNDADGLQGNQFNPGAVFKSQKGYLYFGGPSGLTFFNPNDVKSNTLAPNPVVVGILINNQLQTPTDSSSVLKESVWTLKSFQLAHDQNSLTFLFAATNYLSPQKNRFCYRLVNYDDKWIDCGTQNSATYTKIPPGKYIFQVKAANNDGLWNSNPASIGVVIKTPWWQSGWAYAIYLVVVAAIIVLIQRERFIKQRLLNDVYKEKIKSQSEKELNEAKITFFTNISHDIKTPLSLILSPLSYIIETRSNDAELTDSLKTIQRNANRLKHLLHQVIDMRRGDAGVLKFLPATHNVVAPIHEMTNCFALEARERGIKFDFDTDVDALTAEVDLDKFEKIIFNLLTNAFKFVDDGGEVTVTLERGNTPKPCLIGSTIKTDYLEIAVRNSGSFIDTNEFEAIFDRFYQGAQNRKNGTGIGLHMVKEYVLLHNGQINLFSSREEGTCFVIRLPYKANADKVWLKQNASPQSSSLTVEHNIQAPTFDDSKRKLILLVEDNHDLRSFLRKTLGASFTVVTAPNGKKGYELANDTNPDLIVSDIMMPEMNGLELCRLIKNNDNTSHIPVILLTALSSEAHQIEGYEHGADAYVPKPFNKNLLLSQINNLLLNREKIRERFLDPESSLADMLPQNNELHFISNAVAIVEEHLLDPAFSVETLADKLHISRTSLHRKLKVHTDQSATEFIRFVRLKNALKMLKSGNYSIDEVSYNVGFNTPSYFSQSFKKQFGKSPKDYLKSC